MVVTKEMKSKYNHSAYLKRKSKKDNMIEEIKESILLADEPVVTEPVSIKPPTETSGVEELEITQEEFNLFKQWKGLRNTAPTEQPKKKEDFSYLLVGLKAIGLALAPALLQAIQRAGMKTVEETMSAPSQQHTENSKPSTSSAWELSAPQPLSMP